MKLKKVLRVTFANYLRSVAALAATFYIMVLTGCALVYRYVFDDDSFNKPINTLVDAFYFSTVSITTLGYGEIHPSSDWAKIVASSEALLGVVAVGIFLYGISRSQEQRQDRRNIARYKRLTQRERQDLFSRVKAVLSFIRPSIGGRGPKIGRLDGMMFFELPQPIGELDRNPREGYGFLIDAANREAENEEIGNAISNLDEAIVQQSHFDEISVLLSNIDYLDSIDKLHTSLVRLHGIVNEQKYLRRPGALDASTNEQYQRQEMDKKLQAAARVCYRQLCILYSELWEIEYRGIVDGTTPRAM